MKPEIYTNNVATNFFYSPQWSTEYYQSHLPLALGLKLHEFSTEAHQIPNALTHQTTFLVFLDVSEEM